MNRTPFLELLARLPARVWLQAAVALVGFIVLALLGFAVIAASAAVLLLVVLAFKARQWLRGMFAGTTPAARDRPKVIDVQYEIVDRNKDES